MTATPGEVLVLRRRRRWAVECLVVEAVPAMLAVSAGAAIIGSGPIDYRFYGWMAEITAGIVAMLTVPLLVLRLALGRRVAVMLTPDGIDSGVPGQGRIPWSQIVGLRPVRRLTGRHVLLTRRDAPAIKLYAPRGAGWRLPDPAFRRDIAELRRWATRYGTGIETDNHPRGPATAAIAIAVVVVAVLATAGIRAADRGVIWASTPTVSQVTAACPALQAAGLDRFWPVDTRTLDRDERDRHELGESSYCGWTRRLGRTNDAPYLRISAVVRRHDGYAMSSPIAMAVRSYTSDHTAKSSPKPVPDLGDEAFMTAADDEVQVTARRANVTVTIDINQDPHDPAEARNAARDLTAAILADIRLADPQ